jgi:hypothetical protein
MEAFLHAHTLTALASTPLFTVPLWSSYIDWGPPQANKESLYQYAWAVPCNSTSTKSITGNRVGGGWSIKRVDLPGAPGVDLVKYSGTMKGADMLLYNISAHSTSNSSVLPFASRWTREDYSSCWLPR